MSTQAQVSANQANSQHSTGPRTEEGKAASCKNNFRHGFTGEFTVIPSENQDLFDALNFSLLADHKPQTVVESVLVDKMAQYIWLGRRAINLQQSTMCDPDIGADDKTKLFALYLRYQTTNDRGFHKCLDDLLKLRAEKRKELIGFESQKLREAEEARKQSIENRKLDVHKLDVLLAEAKVDHQVMFTRNLEYSMEAPRQAENHPISEAKAA